MTESSTSQPLTEQERKELRELCERATKAPWHVNPKMLDDGGYKICAEPGTSATHDDPLSAEWICTSWDSVIAEESSNVDYGPNTAFIAVARSALPRALEHIAALERERDAMRAALENCITELEGYADHGQSVKAEHLCSAGRAVLKGELK